MSANKKSVVGQSAKPAANNRNLTLTLVAAMTDNGVIGRRGEMPWWLPAELQLFRQLTMGGILIMGRKTFTSLPAPLPGRINLVVSRHLQTAPGRTVCSSLQTALQLAATLPRPVFIVGGAQLYRQALPRCEKMVLSWVEGQPQGDTFFPAIEWSEWEIEREERYSGFRRCFYCRI
ncbi:dihydrofolate reductase [Geothermobacter hydrogeniphilus]|nr:dihydrofolate reductase [Geothermobacter hydrogeniphilus]